jgi:hypothetical protein
MGHRASRRTLAALITVVKIDTRVPLDESNPPEILAGDAGKIEYLQSILLTDPMRYRADSKTDDKALPIVKGLPKSARLFSAMP